MSQPQLATGSTVATDTTEGRRAGSAAPAGRQGQATDGIAGYVFMGPWLLGFLLLTLGPLLASLYLSFTDYRLLSDARWIGLDNYIEMFTADVQYREALQVTFTYVFVSVPLQLAAALGVALALRAGLRGLGLYRAIYYLPSLLGRQRGAGHPMAADFWPRWRLQRDIQPVRGT